MGTIPSIRILKYFFWDYFILQRQHRKKRNPLLVSEIKEKLNRTSSTFLPQQSLLETTFTVFDLETSGFFPQIGDEIVSIGAIKINAASEKIEEDNFYEVVSPLGKVPEEIYSLTGLTKQQLVNGSAFDAAFLKFLEYSKGTILVAHPASFDIHFLKVMLKRWGIVNFNPEFIDSYFLANYLQPQGKNKLDQLVVRFDVDQKERHHALNDAIMTAEIFLKLLYLLQKNGIHTLEDYFKLKGKKKGKLSVL